jgi:uncharacterized membrane protein
VVGDLVPYLLALHALAAVIWVGGMVFAYWAARPAAGQFEPPLRQGFWRGAFRRFFWIVSGAILVLLGTGYAMIFVGYGGFAGAPLHVHIMQGLGWVMVLLFLALLALPYRRFLGALDAKDHPSAGRSLEWIRRIVHGNMYLGLAVVVIGASGRHW